MGMRLILFDVFFCRSSSMTGALHNYRAKNIRAALGCRGSLVVEGGFNLLPALQDHERTGSLTTPFARASSAVSDQSNRSVPPEFLNNSCYLLPRQHTPERRFCFDFALIFTLSVVNKSRCPV
jgi:hypothetical protein